MVQLVINGKALQKRCSRSIKGGGAMTIVPATMPTFSSSVPSAPVETTTWATVQIPDDPGEMTTWFFLSIH